MAHNPTWHAEYVALETVYPACKTSAFFCRLAGTKTITQEMLRMIRAQGYDIAVETPVLRFAA